MRHAPSLLAIFLALALLAPLALGGPTSSPFVEKSGDEMMGDLVMGLNRIVLGTAALQADADGALRYDGAPVCLDGIGSCGGPPGPAGADGATGPAGEQGPAGPPLATLHDLDGLPCEYDGMRGSVRLTFSPEGAIAFVCADAAPPSCEPTTVPPNTAGTCVDGDWKYVCETGWSDANGDLGDGCEAPVYHIVQLRVVGVGGRIAVVVDGNEMECAGECELPVREGTVVQLSAVPADGTGFMRWSGTPKFIHDGSDDDDCSNIPTCMFTVLTPLDIEAWFGASLSLLVDGQPPVGGDVFVTVDSRTTSCPAQMCAMSIVAGETVRLEAVPQPAYTFEGWTNVCAPDAVCTFTILQHVDIAPVFRPAAS